MNKDFWGWHLLIDLYDCSIDIMKSKTEIENFAFDLVNLIDMVMYGTPQIVHFGSEHTEGFTLTCLIETSLIDAHFANESKSIFLSVHSCKEYSREKVEKFAVEYFKAKKFNSIMIKRGKENGLNVDK